MWHHVQGASECGFHLKKRTPEELVVFIEVAMEACNYHHLIIRKNFKIILKEIYISKFQCKYIYEHSKSPT